jgi:hypothetical protein
VEATSAKPPVVAASKSAAPTSKRFMVREHQSAGKQCNDGNRQFLPHDILLMLQRRVALDSSLVHLRPAIFPITAADHVHLLLGWCDSGAYAPITEETRLEGALFPARDQRPGHLAVFCSISGAFDASLVLVLLTNEEVLDPLTELARE